jgi:cytolysin-activating lysine-acyltransferase
MSSAGGTVMRPAECACKRVTDMQNDGQGSADQSHTSIPGGGADPQTANRSATAPVEAVFGQVVWLMMNTPQFRHVFVADLEWMVLPPILLNQYRLFRADNRTVGFAAWAYLSEAAEARLQQANPRLAPVDWKGGDRLWLIDVFAPFGHQEALLAEVRDIALAGNTFKMHRHMPDGKVTVEVVTGGSGGANA